MSVAKEDHIHMAEVTGLTPVWVWLGQLICWHEWKEFWPEADYPEFDCRVCKRCGKKELIHI